MPPRDPDRTEDAAAAPADGSIAADPRPAVPFEDGTRWLGVIPDTLLATLGIDVREATPERVVATMPVTAAHHQPFGILHGGASVALAETVASLGGCVSLDPARAYAVGLEINANHLRPVRDGILTATATPLHKGRRTHVWQVEIRDARERLVCVARCTLAVVDAERA